jgi:hypothetical protein
MCSLVLCYLHGFRVAGTHVLAGFEILLPLLLASAEPDVSGAISSTFPAERPREADGSALCTDAFVEDHVLAISIAFQGADGDMHDPTAGLCWQVPRDATTLANVNKAQAASAWLAQAERAGVAFLAAAPPPPQFTREGERVMPQPWADLWTASVASAQAALAAVPSGVSVLGYLYARFGILIFFYLVFFFFFFFFKLCNSLGFFLRFLRFFRFFG